MAHLPLMASHLIIDRVSRWTANGAGTEEVKITPLIILNTTTFRRRIICPTKALPEHSTTLVWAIVVYFIRIVGFGSEHLVLRY